MVSYSTGGRRETVTMKNILAGMLIKYEFSQLNFVVKAGENVAIIMLLFSYTLS